MMGGTGTGIQARAPSHGDTNGATQEQQDKRGFTCPVIQGRSQKQDNTHRAKDLIILHLLVP